MGKRLWAGRGLFFAAGCLLLITSLAVLPKPARPPKQAEPATHEETGLEQRLAGYVICVDAGHGGTDGGARAKDSKAWEKDINLSVANKVGAALTDAGARVLYTRPNDDALDSEKRPDLQKRMAVAQAGGADLFLSIHMNEYRTRRESGPQVFYRAGQEKSRLLAGALQSAMIEGLEPQKKRVAMAGDYYVLSLDIPSVLIECGFISNQAEEALLLTEAYQEKIAQAVVQGVCEYCRVQAVIDERIT